MMTVDDLTVGIGKIPYNRDAGPEEVLVFRHYNTNEVWIVFSPVYIIRYMYSLRNMPINRHFLGGMIDAYFFVWPLKVTGGSAALFGVSYPETDSQINRPVVAFCLVSSLSLLCDELTTKCLMLDCAWQDNGRMVEVFCMSLAYLPWNR